MLVTPRLAPKTLGFLSSCPVRGQLAEPVPGVLAFSQCSEPLDLGVTLHSQHSFNPFFFFFKSLLNLLQYCFCFGGLAMRHVGS